MCSADSDNFKLTMEKVLPTDDTGLTNDNTKDCVRRALGKNTASAHYYPGPMLHLKKILAQAISPAKRVMHILKGRKKASLPRKLPNPSLPPEKTMVLPLAQQQTSFPGQLLVSC